MTQEIDELPRFLITRLKKHYPGYEKWLEDAIKVVKEGGRMAFGMMGPTGRDKSGNLVEGLVGTALLKLTKGDSAELKSFVISSNEEKKFYDYGKRLLDYIDENCKKKGYRKIWTDNPCSEDSLIKLFLDNGFSIVGREDLYRSGRHNYLLSKNIIPSYAGDPYDWRGLGIWLLENFYEAMINNDEENKSESSPIKFKLKVKPLESTNTPPDDVIIKGIAMVSDSTVRESHTTTFVDLIRKGDYNLGIFIAKEFEENAGDLCSENNILKITEGDLSSTFGCKLPDFSREDIKGMIVEIKKMNYDRILATVSNNGSFAYFKGGPKGKYLKRGDAILFYMMPAPESTNGCLCGQGKIKDVNIGDPDEIWGRYKDLNPLLDKKEYDRFKEFKREMIAIAVEDFEEVPPIDLDGLRDILSERSMQIEDVGHRYVNDDILDKIEEKVKELEERGIKAIEEQSRSFLSHLDKFKRYVEKKRFYRGIPTNKNFI